MYRLHSHIFKHTVECRHEVLVVIHYSIFRKGYWNNTKKRKISEVLIIKDIKPTLNSQDESIALKILK